jgi:hypothetical protein
VDKAKIRRGVSPCQEGGTEGQKKAFAPSNSGLWPKYRSEEYADAACGVGHMPSIEAG